MNRQSKRRALGALITVIITLLAWRSIPAQSQAPSTLKIESDDPQVLREGQWISQPTSTASGGSYLYNDPARAESAQEAVLQLSFAGPTLEVIYVSGPTLGTLALEVDGTVLRTVITTADKTSYGHSTRIDYLTNEDHILRVYAQAGDVVGVDAFIIPSGANGTMQSAMPRDALGSGGWMATYFRRFPTSTSCTIPTLTDSPPPSGATMYGPYPVAEISFDWGSTGGPGYVAPTTDTFGIIFRRTVTFAEDTTLTINYWADDGIRMLDNGTRFVNSWGCNAGAPASIIRTFAAGVHNLEIQYIEITGQAHIIVTFSTPLLTATPIATTQVHLAWNDSFPDETDYRVERSPVGTPNWAEIATLSADSTSYDDTGLVCGTYTYRVRAYFGSTATYSPYSNAATVDTGPCMGNPPTNLAATAVDFGQIRLDWTDNASDETEYRLERSWDGDNYWLVLGTVAADTTTLTDSGLPCNLTYYYRVRGYRASDTAVSAYSNVTSATTRACLEAPPSNLTATALDGSRIQLNWTDTTTGETEFWIDRAILSLSNWYFIGTVPGESTSYTDTDLDCNTSYQYHIEAHRAGDSDWSGDSNSATATTGPCLLVTPTALTATPLSDGQIRLTWSDTNSDETEYRVERSWDGINNWAEIGTTPANTTTYINISLDCATPYYYRVRAYRTADMAYSAYSEIGTATTLTCPTNCTPLGQMSRVSLTSTGAEAATGGDGGAVSFDGRYVAFTAGALVSEDTNNRSDVYLRDNMTCQLWRVSVGSDGRQSDNTSGFADMSDDGRYVVFISFATNLDIDVLDEVDYDLDVYVHDRLTGQTRRLSATADGTPGTDVSYEVKISANGHYAIFASQAPNLPAGDTFPSNGTDFFIVDLETNAMSRVILPIPTNYGIPSPPESFDISGDGNTIVFTAWQPGIVPEDTDDATDLFIYDRPTNQVSRVLLGIGGVQANNGGVGDADVSYGGQYITFASLATNIVPNDTNGQRDVFVYDRQTSQVSRVSVSSSGVEGNNTSWRSTISIGGRYVTFVSLASNLVAGDTNGMYDVFVHDRQTAQTIRVSTAANGTEGNQPTTTGHISGNGQWVVFPSKATNLVNGDANVSSDVFMADLAMYFAPTNLTATPIGASQITLNWVDNSLDETTYRIERSPDGKSNWVEITTIAANTTTYVNTNLDCRTLYYYRVRAYRAFDGSYSAYSNIASATTSLCSLVAPTNLTATPFTDSQIQLTWVDNPTDETEYRLERSPNGTDNWVEIGTAPANMTTYTNVSLLCNTPYFYRVRAYRASDMTYSVYSNVANATTAACPASCTHDPKIYRTSESASGVAGNNNSQNSDISGDGRYVAFQSDATNLVVGDTNGQTDIFVKDLLTCQVWRISVASDGTQGTGTSTFSDISSNGRYVGFVSGSNLISNDSNNAPDAYAHDLWTGQTILIAMRPEPFAQAISSGGPVISDNGFAAFIADGGGWIGVPTNGTYVLARQLPAGEFTIGISWDAGLVMRLGNGPLGISADGQYIVFSTTESLLPSDINNQADIYLRDTTSNTTSLVSVSSGGVQGNGVSLDAAISPNGRYIVFESDATNLVAGDSNNLRDIYLRDTQTNTTRRVSIESGAVEGNAAATRPVVADTGEVYFESGTTNWVSGVSGIQIFRFDPMTNNLTLVSRSSAGLIGSGASGLPHITPDGHFIVFQSTADNLVNQDTGNQDTFLINRLSLFTASSLNGTPLSATQIRLTWGDINENETNYRIERSPNGTTYWAEIGTTPANTTTYTNADLICGTTYYYRVRAYRASDSSYSGYSNIANATTAACRADALALFNPTTHTGNLIRTLTNPPVASDYVYYATGFPQGVGGQYVMGDWNGDGLDTMGVYRNGAFWYTNDYGQTGNWTGIWFGLGGQAIAGRFNGTIGHDCIGVTDSGTWTTGDTFFALYFTCNLTSGPTPTLTYQWLSIVLPTSAGHSGSFQFSAGDFDGDGVDSIAIRRGNYIAWTNVAPTTLLSEFSLAQYFGAPGTGDEGKFVVGDWDLNNVDSFGLVYQNGRFYRRNDLQWNSNVYLLQQFTSLVGTPFGVTTWQP